MLVTLGPRGWFDWVHDANTTGRPDGSDAAGVRVVDYAPLDVELANTSVLVHHGGSNTIRAAIEFGVASPVIPQAAEQYRNARWIEANGLGTVLLPEQVTPDRVAHALGDLLADPRVSQATAAARAGWLALPPPEETMARVYVLGPLSRDGPAGQRIRSYRCRSVAAVSAAPHALSRCCLRPPALPAVGAPMMGLDGEVSVRHQ